jgi:hypothetical protein
LAISTNGSGAWLLANSLIGSVAQILVVFWAVLARIPVYCRFYTWIISILIRY